MYSQLSHCRQTGTVWELLSSTSAIVISQRTIKRLTAPHLGSRPTVVNFLPTPHSWHPNTSNLIHVREGGNTLQSTDLELFLSISPRLGLPWSEVRDLYQSVMKAELVLTSIHSHIRQDENYLFMTCYKFAVTTVLHDGDINKTVTSLVPRYSTQSEEECRQYPAAHHHVSHVIHLILIKN